MCGIVGIVSRHDGHVDAARICRMRDAIGHRGPDGEGLWTDGPVALGHRRLAIIDLAGGQQPMSNAAGTTCLVYNGEIYNFGDLRGELIARGRHLTTRSDTETILHLYDMLGDTLVDRLHGMFAFAIWDAQRRRLLLARDRLGIKPLYYALTEREFVFASEVKAIVASGAIRPALNAAVLPEFLATRYVSGDETFFEGVRKLPPGHILTWSATDGPRRRRYWRLPSPQPEEESFGAVAQGLRTGLTAAVRRHLMSDVPLGVFLSGGLDSSAVAALTTSLTGEPVHTFAVGFEDADANELPYARQMADYLGATHREVVVSPADFFAALPKLVWHEDEPIAFTSSVPLYFVAKLASEHVKVVLTGEGADELFLGYNRYRLALWNARLLPFYRALTPTRLRERVRGMVGRLEGAAGRHARRTLLGLDASVRGVCFDSVAVFPEALRLALLPRRTWAGRDPFVMATACYEQAAGNTLERLSATDAQTYLHELLMKQDQMSMAASIESRVPFLDDTLVDQVMRLPSRYKLNAWRTKAVLRAAISDLVPPEILSRRKMGFPVPIGRWLRGAHRPVVDEFVLGARARARGMFRSDVVQRIAAEHATGRADHGERLWLLINLEIWRRIVDDGEDVAHIMTPVTRRVGTSDARAMGQDGRVVAVEHRRPTAQLPHPVGPRPGA